MFYKPNYSRSRPYHLAFVFDSITFKLLATKQRLKFGSYLGQISNDCAGTAPMIVHAVSLAGALSACAVHQHYSTHNAAALFPEPS